MALRRSAAFSQPQLESIACALECGGLTPLSFPKRCRAIVAMTAHAMKGDREMCWNSGMDGYVSKPLQPNELFDVIENLMGPRRDGPHAPSENSNEQ